MSINDLFCIPEQGRRLAELVPGLTSAFMWALYGDNEPFITDKTAITNGAFVEYDCMFFPALTLQELRDVVKSIDDDCMAKTHNSFLSRQHKHEFQLLLNSEAAWGVAAWVIERLEEVQP